jgi:hypothetical protein
MAEAMPEQKTKISVASENPQRAGIQLVKKLRGFFCGFVHGLVCEVFEQGDIDPALAGIIVEQFALDPATCGDICIASHENSARIGTAHRGIEHHAADRVRRDLVPGVLQLGIDMRLALHVGNRAIGLGHVERDRTFGERFEDARRERGQAQTSFDETDSETEAARHVFGRSPRIDDRSEGLRLVGGVHRQTLEVLGKAGLTHIAFLAFDDEASDLMAFGQGALFGQRLQRGETATAGLDLELAALSFAHDEVLQQAARSNVCPQLEVGQHVARLANVARARDELLQGNRLDHGCSPDGMKAQVRITRPTSPKGSLHSHSEIGVCPRDQAASAGRTDEAFDTGTNRRVR